MDSSSSAGPLTGSTSATPCSLNFSLAGQFVSCIVAFGWLFRQSVWFLFGQLNLLTWLVIWSASVIDGLVGHLEIVDVALFGQLNLLTWVARQNQERTSHRSKPRSLCAAEAKKEKVRQERMNSN